MDIEKTMESILNAQARLEAAAQQHEGRIARFESSMATATDLIGRLEQAEIRLTQRMSPAFERFVKCRLRALNRSAKRKLRQTTS